MSATLPVAAASFCPVSLSPGNHQAAILDLDLALLIVEPCLAIVRPKACHLNMQLPQTKACYLAILEEFFHSRQLLPQLFQFYKDAAQPSFDATMAGPLFEHLEKLCIKDMHLAKKHCQKLYMGTLAFSPTLTLWFNQKILWNLIHKNSLEVWWLPIESTDCCGVANPLSVSAEVTLYNYKTAKKEHQELHPKASQLWVEFLQQKLLSPGLSEEISKPPAAFSQPSTLEIVSMLSAN